MKFAIAIGALTLAMMSGPASASSLCTSTSDCILTFDEHNGGFSGITLGAPYGTVELALTGNTIKVTLDMNPDLVLIGTGFPGTFGFNDSVGGNIIAGNFSSSNYSGSANNGGDETKDLHFDGFGYFDDAAGATAPHAGSSDAISSLNFVLSRTGGFSSIQQLIESPTGGGDGSPYFVADVFDKACGANGGTACTGLVGVSNLNTSTVPEPSSYTALIGVGLAAIGWVSRRKRLVA